MVKKFTLLVMVLLTFSQCLYVMFPHEFEVKVDFDEEDSPKYHQKKDTKHNSEIETQSTQVQDSLDYLM